MSPQRVIVYGDGFEVTFYSDGESDTDALMIAESGVEGWYSTPDLKTGYTERGTGDGAHDVSASDVLYASRVVTLHFIVNARTRNGILSLVEQVERLAHQLVRFRLVDDGCDSFVQGMCAVNVPGEYGRDGWLDDCSLTVTCVRPERLAWTAQKRQVSCLYESYGGLFYGGEAKGLVYPLSYGGVASDARNVCTLVNRGSSRAYPIFTINGSYSISVELSLSCDGKRSTLGFRRGANDTAPAVLDTRSRTASMGGVDVSEDIYRRGFMSIPPQGAMTVVLSSAGSGWVDVECRDTWM